MTQSDEPRKETRQEQLDRLYPGERSFMPRTLEEGALMALIAAGVLVPVDPSEEQS